MEQLTGRADIYLNGVYSETTQDGSSISTLGGAERTLVTNSRGATAGFTEKSVPAQIKAMHTHGSDFDVELLKVTPLSIDFICDNGVIYQMADATYLKDDGLDPSKGTVSVTYGGDLVRI